MYVTECSLKDSAWLKINQNNYVCVEHILHVSKSQYPCNSANNVDNKFACINKDHLYFIK
jgi:hypothetical protein